MLTNGGDSNYEWEKSEETETIYFNSLEFE